MTILVTGSAGFIGNAVALKLLELGEEVVGLDSVNEYYDPALKEARLERLKVFPNFTEARLPLEDMKGLTDLFARKTFKSVLHYAAQPGVRYSFEQPASYVSSNLTGFGNILEVCRRYPVEHLVFASSSSVYGSNRKDLLSEQDISVHPLNLYAATKRSNELMAHSYSNLYGLPVTGLRLFSVYGPWGRPDMAAFLFTKAIIEGTPIRLFNQGNMERDLTYIDDIVTGSLLLLQHLPKPNPDWEPIDPDPATSDVPYSIYNIGNSQPVLISEFVSILEELLGRSAIKEMLPMQPGEALRTYADVSKLKRIVGYQPKTHIREGLKQFVDWYRDFYSID